MLGKPISHRVMHRRRRGAVSVEMALTVPLLFFIVFASVEFGRMNMLRHSVDNAAYEAARRGVLPGATKKEVEDTALEIMGIVGARKVNVTVTPSDLSTPSDTVHVEVTFEANANGFISPSFFSSQSITGVSTMRREQL